MAKLSVSTFIFLAGEMMIRMGYVLLFRQISIRSPPGSRKPRSGGLWR